MMNIINWNDLYCTSRINNTPPSYIKDIWLYSILIAVVPYKLQMLHKPVDHNKICIVINS